MEPGRFGPSALTVSITRCSPVHVGYLFGDRFNPVEPVRKRRLNVLARKWVGHHENLAINGCGRMRYYLWSGVCPIRSKRAWCGYRRPGREFGDPGHIADNGQRRKADAKWQRDVELRRKRCQWRPGPGQDAGKQQEQDSCRSAA